MTTSVVNLKRSAVPGKVPLTTQLELGEVSINTFDGRMFIKKNNGTESIVEVNATPASGLVRDFVGTGETLVIGNREQHITVQRMEVAVGGFIDNNGILAIL